MSKNTGITVGSTVSANGGKIATVVSIKGRWVKVRFQDGSEKNVGFNDCQPFVETAGRKNGVVPASYLSRYTTHKMDGGTVVRDNGDEAAVLLRGLALDDIYKEVAKRSGMTKAELQAKYQHLNAGMQRMSLSNVLRRVLRQGGGGDD